jgi:biopolymer transport protein ExbD
VKLRRNFNFTPALFAVIPLVNVLFLVLVFYTMGSRFILQPGVQISLAPTFFAFGPQSSPQIVSITAAPQPEIFHRDGRVSVSKLVERLTPNTAAERTLIIKADRNSPVGVRDEIANAALRLGYTVIIAGEIPKP